MAFAGKIKRSKTVTEIIDPVELYYDASGNLRGKIFDDDFKTKVDTLKVKNSDILYVEFEKYYPGIEKMYNEVFKPTVNKAA